MIIYTCTKCRQKTRITYGILGKKERLCEKCYLES